LFLALFAAALWGPLIDSQSFQVIGTLLALVLCGLGLVASFFHLGHPERAWRSAAMWRSSWLSREVIALPLFMLGLAVYAIAQFIGWPATPAIGAVVALLCLALFVCTAMVYASIRFLQEWASPLTLANYLLFGCASGFMLATWLASMSAATALLVVPLALAAAAFTLAALATRGASLRRNARLKPVSTLQTAIGIKHPRIVQKAQGFMGGSFNTREFFHGRSIEWLRGVKWAFLLLVFPLPLACLWLGLSSGSVALLAAAFVLQYLGLLAERWFFLAQARHPQNLYYQTIS
jgi:DMSO reductase anchor subunit